MAQTGNENHIDILGFKMTLIWYIFTVLTKLPSNCILA